MHAILVVQPGLKALDVDSSIFARWLQQLVSQFDTLARISHQAACNTYDYWLFGEK